MSRRAFGVSPLAAFAFAFACAIVSPGCEPSHATPTRAEPPRVHDVHFLALCRDLPTARAFAGCRVRVRLGPGDYEVRGREAHARAHPDAPPLVVFECLQAPPAGVTLTLTGTCGEPCRDGRWRSRHADFWVRVEGCTFTTR